MIRTREEICMELISGDSVASRDKATFEDWCEHRITTKEMIDQFKATNHIQRDMEIDEKVMINWVESLGYRRGKYDD